MANINLSGTVHHELQSSVINERIKLLETCMGNLCDVFGKVARKNARLRDTGDQMVSIIVEYSGKEKINTSSKKGLVNYSSFVSAVEDYRNAMIQRVEKKIIQPISKYQEYLKSSKKTIKSTVQIRDKEKAKQKKLSELMQRQPDDGRNIAQAEANAESAAQKVASQDKILAEEIDKLEEKKLNDMKNLLKEYTHIQMIFHAKALEMLTVAYNELLDINTENDLEEFRNTFTQSNIQSFVIGSKQSLNSSYKDSNENVYSGGGSLPTTPGRNRSSTLRETDAKRSKSNENIKKASTQSTSKNTNGSANLNGKNQPNYNSAPNLNNSSNSRLNKSQQLEVEDMTDDSDMD